MSGIVGIVNLDGTPIDRQLLQQMTDFMSYRGPDGQKIWVDGNVGFGHAMLRTTTQSLTEEQPCSLEGEVWITADARIDGRADLIQTLKSQECGKLEAATDAELILQAYRVWGEDCSKHLLGDFAFAIWDSRQQRLLCSRDPFWVKPFYYARVGNCFIFSNTLNCIRIHPEVSEKLNELAIADFLVFGGNQAPETTTFADIGRLPPAHNLIASREALRLNRYWTLPIDGYIRYKRASDYVEHFQELMGAAVNDRMRCASVGVFMSGGMDSSTVAATAKTVLSQQSKPFDLVAHTLVYDQLIPDRERYYSGLVAQALDIPIHYLVEDDYKLYERWEQPELYRPEPVFDPLLAITVDQFKQAASYSRVVLDGSGGDPVLFGSSYYFFRLLKRLQLGELIAVVGQYIKSHQRLPPIGLRTQIKRKLGMWKPWQYPYPGWLNPDFAARLDLPRRWEEMNREPAPMHPTRPEAYQVVSSNWSNFFESYDSGVTLVPLEVRYPFFDLRLMNYLLAIPPIPWFIRKELTRVAMEGILPEAVLHRPKTPLAANPLKVLLQQPEAQWVDRFEATPELSQYVKRDSIPSVCGKEEYASAAWMNLRPLSLAYWLQQPKPFKSLSARKEPHEVKSRTSDEEKLLQS